MPPDCIFCKIIAGELPSYKIHEDDRVLAFLDIHPVNAGHALVIPKVHTSNVCDSDDTDATAVLSVARRLAPAIQQSVGAQGCNLTFNCGAAAGQIIFHTHLHVIPRFENDGHKSWHSRGEAGDLAATAEKIKTSLAGA